jgi:MSHA biogenesis protein MshL
MVIEVVLHDEFAGGLDLRRLNSKDVAGLLSALATQGAVNVMASPTVTALNNEPAIMRVGTQDVFFKTTTQTDAVTGRVFHTTEPQSVTEGIVLSVTPQIASDGMINISISPSFTERTGEATSRFGDTAPILSVRQADTMVRVHDTETIVVAGLMDERARPDVTKVPFFGDLPGVGKMFRGEKPGRRKTDLIILLTPTIMTPARVAQAAANELERVR